jgi:RNA recognition motif-containing protein
MIYKRCSRKREQLISLIEDRETGRSRGFGFIEMSTKEEGAAAANSTAGASGRALKVNEAKPRIEPALSDN